MAEKQKKNGHSSTTENSVIDPESKSPEFAIQRIYVKDLSLETPHSPLIFQEEWHPNVDVQLNASTQKLSDTVFEVKLTITVTTQVKEKVAFLAEAQQAGIFTLANFSEAQLHRMLGSYCPNILFPFLRELISELVVKAGFPPLYLAPINFDALYEQQIAQQQKNLAENGEEQTSEEESS